MDYFRSPKIIAGTIILLFGIIVLATYGPTDDRTNAPSRANNFEEHAPPEKIKKEKDKRKDMDHIIIGSVLFFGILMMLSGIYDVRKKARYRSVPGKCRR